jgi:hypothetical protein
MECRLIDSPQAGRYVIAWRKAKSLNPEQTYFVDNSRYATGAELQKEFLVALQHRINTRGNEEWRNIITQAEIELFRDQQDLHNWLQKRIICRRLRTPKLQRRFASLLFTED